MTMCSFQLKTVQDFTPMTLWHPGVISSKGREPLVMPHGTMGIWLVSSSWAIEGT